MNTDEQLRRDVLDALRWEPRLDASEIGVAVADGIVTLTGTVPVYVQRFIAEKTVKGVRGVRGVANDVWVHPPADGRRTDTEIVAAVLYALKWDAAVPDDRIKAIVRDGWIILEGTVDRQDQRESADRAIRHMAGARGVTNNIEVKPRAGTAEDAKVGIEAALRRSAILDPASIQVEVSNGAIALRGEVDSFAERAEAERLAWAAPGVARVENQIEVVPRCLCDE
jgi:osmotically-inducible protein OsmY